VVVKEYTQYQSLNPLAAPEKMFVTQNVSSFKEGEANITVHRSSFGRWGGEHVIPIGLACALPI
jgi:hypothetical protein